MLKLRRGFTGIEIVVVVGLVVGLIAGSRLVQKPPKVETNASTCSPIGGHCEGGRAWWCYGDRDEQGARCCNGSGYNTNPAQWFDCPVTVQPQCDPANSLHCRNDGKAWWCNSTRQWEAGEGKICSNKCSPIGSDTACSNSTTYKDVGSSCGTNAFCNATGSSNGFTTCSCQTVAVPPAPVPAGQSCTSPNTLYCVNGLSAWCDGNRILQPGTKPCSTSTCYPYSPSSIGCINTTSYIGVGSSCGNNGICRASGAVNGFATCGCVVPTAIPTIVPTAIPTLVPTIIPTLPPPTIPTAVPTVRPTTVPTVRPTTVPTVAIPRSTGVAPTLAPTVVATTLAPTARPTIALPPPTVYCDRELSDSACNRSTEGAICTPDGREANSGLCQRNFQNGKCICAFVAQTVSDDTHRAPGLPNLVPPTPATVPVIVVPSNSPLAPVVVQVNQAAATISSAVRSFISFMADLFNFR